jgi:hypothetical protein
MMSKLRCLLMGHDDLPRFEQARIRLQCGSCGRQTAGWSLDAPRPVPLRDRVVRFRQRLKRSAA